MARGFNYAPGASPQIEQAAEPGLSAEQIRELAQSKNYLVREAVAQRDDCPLGVIFTLAQDDKPSVRALLAANPIIPGGIVGHLLHDTETEVLLALLANPSIERAAVEKLAFHANTKVREAAATVLAATGYLHDRYQ